MDVFGQFLNLKLMKCLTTPVLSLFSWYKSFPISIFVSACHSLPVIPTIALIMQIQFSQSKNEQIPVPI